MDALFNLSSAFGLSASAGLNAYIPLLVVGLAAKYKLLTLSDPWNVLSNSWVLGILAVLLVIEMTVDKIPAADTLNDIIQTVGRPAAGAIVFAANTGTITDMDPAMAFVVGLLVAGGVHGAKAVSRPFVTATTGGMGNWAVSTTEDGVSLAGSVLAIAVPIATAIFVIFFFMLFGLWYVRRRMIAV